MIQLHFRAIDNMDGWIEKCDTVEEAVSTFQYYMGNMYDRGSSYCVNAYGDVTCTLEGATWEQLGVR